MGGASAHNRRVIVDALRINGALSRAELARSTLLTRQTTSNIVDELEVAEWHAYPLAEMFSKATGLSVRIFNDAAAATIAEKLGGVAHGIENFIYIFLAYGIGAGVVLNGELYEGARGNVGEIGEMILN